VIKGTLWAFYFLSERSVEFAKPGFLLQVPQQLTFAWVVNDRKVPFLEEPLFHSRKRPAMTVLCSSVFAGQGLIKVVGRNVRRHGKDVRIGR
jgi:hypothetical protein